VNVCPVQPADLTGVDTDTGESCTAFLGTTVETVGY